MCDISVALRGHVKYTAENRTTGVEFQEIRQGDRPLLDYVLDQLKKPRPEDFADPEVITDHSEPITGSRLLRLPLQAEARNPHRSTRFFNVAQARRFALESTQIIQLGAADFGGAQQIHSVDHFGVHGEERYRRG